jgi:geranylgeranyl transferase type-2 subunit alpha
VTHFFACGPTELELVQSAVFTEPKDQSAWLYYRWLISQGLTLGEIVEFTSGAEE